jgi:hypothetical protein
VIESQRPEALRAIARYAEELADYRSRTDDNSDRDDTERRSTDRPDDLPDDVPAKATVTVKEINDN